MKNRGYFITIEGVEGSGKSLLQHRLIEHLQTTEKNVVGTREPGGTALGKSLRELLLDPSNTHVSSITEIMLFAADRAQHIAEVVAPALKRNAIVISDRHIHSTLAYQGYGRGMDINTIKSVNDLALQNITPDLVVLIDLDPEIGISRAATRAATHKQCENSSTPNCENGWTRFEEEKLSFHKRVRNGFLDLADKSSYPFVIVDGTNNPDNVFRIALDAILKLLNGKHPNSKQLEQ